MELYYDNKKSQMQILKNANSINYDINIDNKSLLFKGDNFDVLSFLLKKYKNKIDLVYIDPPFNTENDFYVSKTRANSISANKNSVLAYSDKMSKEEYLEFLRERLVIIKELLSEKGSLYLHIDDKIGQYVKVIMDEIFGGDNFKNDITRIKSNPKNFYRRAYGNEKDRILFYSKNSQKNIWKDLRIPLEDSEIKEKFTKIDDKGRRYTTIPLHAPGETKNGITGKPWRNIPVPEGRHWRTDPAEFDKLDKQGDIEWSLNGNPRIKKYADEHKGKRIQDIWKFKDPQKPIYPTEKNMEMLKRIILQSSDENSIVLDCFAGSGTTLECASKLGRKWIGVDNSDIAIDKIKNRQIGEYQFIDITKVNKINTKQKIHSYEVKIGNMVNVQ